MSTFQQTLEAYKEGQVALGELRSAMLAELADEPDTYERLRREIVRACKTQRVAPDALEDLLDAFDEGKTRIASVHSVVLPGQEDATVFDDDATECVEQTALASGATSSGRRLHGTVVAAVPATAALTPSAQPPNPGEGLKLKPGDVLNDQFELEEAVGEGGMGVIFRAKDTLDMQFSNSNPYVAVKVLSESFSDHRDSVMALHRETRNARSLRHDNIVRVDTFARDSRTGQYFMVMEYLRGEPLNRYMQRKGGKRLSYDEVWRISEGAGEGLKHAHAKGIIHSDIKPSNIWITEDRNVKVLDFGIARVAKPDTQTVWDGLAALSVPYATQEMLRREDPDERDDVYALACVTYELLTGHHPFQKIDAIQAESEGLAVKRPKGLKSHHWRTLKQSLNLHREERTPNISAFLDGMRPTKPPIFMITSAVLLTLVMVGGGLAAGLGWFEYVSTPDADDLFLTSLLEIPADNPLAREDLNDYLDEGHFIVDEGRQEFENGDFQEANRSLKNGVSTAFRAYYTVIRGTEDAMMRQAAALGILSIHKLYSDTIAGLRDERMPKKALWLACQALAQPPGTRTPEWPRLVALYEDLWREVKGEEPGSYAGGCNSNQVLDSWGDPVSLRSPGTPRWRVPPAAEPAL